MAWCYMNTVSASSSLSPRKPTLPPQADTLVVLHVPLASWNVWHMHAHMITTVDHLLLVMIDVIMMIVMTVMIAMIGLHMTGMRLREVCTIVDTIVLHMSTVVAHIGRQIQYDLITGHQKGHGIVDCTTRRKKN